MAELLRDGSFEVGDGATLGGLAARTEEPEASNSGSWYCLMLARSSAFLGNATSSATWSGIKLVAGQTYTLRAATWTGVVVAWSSLRVDVDVGDGVLAEFATFTGTDGAYQIWRPGSFVALGSVGRVRFRTSDPTVTLPGLGGFGTWLLDDVSLEGLGVAVKLGERAVDATISALQTWLPTELTAIDTDRADGITLAAPATGDYYNRPLDAVVSGSACSIEVYEGEIEFETESGNPYIDQDAQRAAYAIPLTIRVTCHPRAGEEGDKTVDRMRRYAAGVYNVFNKHPRLGSSDDSIHGAVIERVLPHWDTGAEPSTIRKFQIELAALVRCEELQT